MAKLFVVLVILISPIIAFSNVALNDSKEQKVSYVSQFSNPIFPDIEQSVRQLVNNKRLFKWYANRDLTIHFVNNGVESFDLCINGERINTLGKIRKSEFNLIIDKKLMHNGTANTLSIQKVEPKGSSLVVDIPYPTLEKGSPEDVGFSRKKLNIVNQFIENDVRNGFPGASLIIIKDGEIVEAKSFGYARKYQSASTLMKKPEKATPNTLYDLASNTKMFATNFAIMHLVSEGKINIDDPVHKYIPIYSGKDKNGQSRDERTIKDLLTHSAGYMPDPQFFNPKSIAKYGKELYSNNKEETEKIICTRLPFERARGGVPNYSDVDYMLLGLVVEHVTDMTLDKYVETHLYNRLGLTHTVFNPLLKGFKVSDCAATELDGNSRGGTVIFPNERKGVIQGEVHDEKSYYCMGGVSGHAGLFSDIYDMAVLSQVMLNNGGYGNFKLWNQDVESEFIKPSDHDITFGLGWRRQGDENLTWHFGAYASEYAVGHTGWTGTVTVIDPKYDMAIILLTNKKHSIIPKPKKSPNDFQGDSYETGKYGSIMTLIYEALLDDHKIG